ncbi:MAG: PilZ domain-containing protein [Gammaproteobacteria bacterium]|nr:PilZ domain-containing protein [Gammaproteobacteria bacterium]MCI0591750.1 PilZ domain-containing protein [Gammaproteobacteria bacterium]
MSADDTKRPILGKRSGSFYHGIYEERRRFPRLIVNRRAEIRKAQGHVVNALVHDISPDGLQVRCDRDAAKILHPSGRFITPENASEVDVRLSVALQKGEMEVKARCRLVYLAVVPGSIAFGMKFIKFYGDSAKILKRFIEESMEPA